jgi:hypothetical protein
MNFKKFIFKNKKEIENKKQKTKMSLFYFFAFSFFFQTVFSDCQSTLSTGVPTRDTSQSSSFEKNYCLQQGWFSANTMNYSDYNLCIFFSNNAQANPTLNCQARIARDASYNWSTSSSFPYISLSIGFRQCFCMDRVYSINPTDVENISIIFRSNWNSLCDWTIEYELVPVHALTIESQWYSERVGKIDDYALDSNVYNGATIYMGLNMAPVYRLPYGSILFFQLRMGAGYAASDYIFGSSFQFRLIFSNNSFCTINSTWNTFTYGLTLSDTPILNSIDLRNYTIQNTSIPNNTYWFIQTNTMLDNSNAIYTDPTFIDFAYCLQPNCNLHFASQPTFSSSTVQITTIAPSDETSGTNEEKDIAVIVHFGSFFFVLLQLFIFF